MELINQYTKAIMEECKLRAIKSGLNFDKETLEYIVTNKDMIELSPKVMIPTLYDYWVNDVEVLKGKGKYKLYPSNPYETVINSRPAVSFYNDNNPDWMNIMIFYHVLGHIDFFQNNILFKHTWNDDFVGQALADKRLIESLRSEHGRWVDYVIEFGRGIDNIVGYFSKLASLNYPKTMDTDEELSYYFSIFLQEIENVPQIVVFNEVERYNKIVEKDKTTAKSVFLAEVKRQHPEFSSKFQKYNSKEKFLYSDLLEFLITNSPFLKKEENKWMKSVLKILRNTSMYFSPQIRTKIANEGWASYWHDRLFRQDDRISGHESAFAKLNAGVTSIRRIGLNPYAIGLRLFQHVRDLSNKGRISREFQQLNNINDRKKYNKHTNKGDEFIFKIRENFSDFMFINTFVDQDFVDKYNLFVVGKRLDKSRGVYQYYVKSRKAKDYKKMLLDSLYHPPNISVNIEKTNDKNLYLVHLFEGKQLVKDYIADTMLGIEYLWGSTVQLETTEIIVSKKQGPSGNLEYKLKKVLYTMKERKVSKKDL
jgi:stage V sporulation protein R